MEIKKKKKIVGPHGLSFPFIPNHSSLGGKRKSKSEKGVGRAEGGA